MAASGLAPQSWTKAAQARLLPDRFTVLGYLGGQQVVFVTGAPVPATLAVSPNPSATDELSVDAVTGVLHVPTELRSITDFDQAVAVGMGVRIPLTEQIRQGLDRSSCSGCAASRPRSRPPPTWPTSTRDSP